MKPEKQNLIHDLLDGDSSREAVLRAGGRVLRRRRQLRTAVQGAGVLAVVAMIATLCMRKQSPPRSVAQVASVVAKPHAAAQAQALTDEQLLEMFPNTPVGLASQADGKKRLIFPRAGDERRFITRL